MTPDEIAALTAERDALKAAKWDVQHTDAMNDFVSLGIDRDEWEAKAKALTAPAEADQIKIEAQAAEIARLREAGLWLLRHSSGATLRQHGIVLNDTSDLDNFIAARAALVQP